MSFFNNTSSCQANAAPLHKLATSTDRDLGTFQANGRSSQIPSNIHHFQNVDTTIQNEFNTFSNDTQNLNLNYDLPGNLKGNGFSRAPQSVNFSSAPQTWNNEFNTFMAESNQTQHSQHQQANHQHHNLQGQYPHVQQQHLLPRQFNNIYSTSLNSANVPLYSSDQQHKSQQNAAVKEKTSPAVHEMSGDFDAIFSELEGDLNSELQSQEKIIEEEDTHPIVDEEDKIKFAILAQNVFNTMNNTPKNISANTSNKFKASGFMQLMNRISNREIEISNDKKKLVDQNGMDIRSDLADPLAGLQINDKLNSSFDAAIKVTQNTPVGVNTSSWQGDFI